MDFVFKINIGVFVRCQASNPPFHATTFSIQLPMERGHAERAQQIHEQQSRYSSHQKRGVLLLYVFELFHLRLKSVQLQSATLKHD